MCAAKWSTTGLHMVTPATRLCFFSALSCFPLTCKKHAKWWLDSANRDLCIWWRQGFLLINRFWVWTMRRTRSRYPCMLNFLTVMLISSVPNRVLCSLQINFCCLHAMDGIQWFLLYRMPRECGLTANRALAPLDSHGVGFVRNGWAVLAVVLRKSVREFTIPK